MSNDIEKINSDLDKAKGHLQNARGIAQATHDTGEAIWETAGRLIAPPNRLSFLGSAALFFGEKLVKAQDITDIVDAAATGYGEAGAELSAVMEGSTDNHIHTAKAHLHNAAELLREGHMDATTQSRMIEANFEQLRENADKIYGLLLDISDAALGVYSAAGTHAIHARNAVDSIESYQNRL